jgi:hypothetical protein
VFTTLCGLGYNRGVLLCLYLLLLGGQLWCLLHCEANFEVLVAEAIMTRTTLSDWTPWYVEELDNNNKNNLHKVKCRICGDTFTKKNSRMLSHLGYIRSTGERDNNVRLYKNMKPDVARAFRGCGGVAPVPPKPAESQHLQGSAQSEEPICQVTPSSTMQESYGASQHLPPVVGAIWTSSAAAPQLPASTGPSSAQSRQQSTIPECHVKEHRRKCDMAWAEFFYSANIPFAATRSMSFKRAMKMMSEMKKLYLPPSYHDIRKRLLSDTKNKIKGRITKKTKMFTQTYGAMLAGDGWSSINNHPLFNIMCVSPTGEEFLEAIDTSGHTKDVVYIADVMKRYLIEVGPENVVQICTDNASVMRKAVHIVQEDWPHLYFCG